MTRNTPGFLAALALMVSGLGWFSAAPEAAAAVEIRGVTPTLYRYSLAWHPGVRVLEGPGKIRVANRGKRSVKNIWLRLRPNQGDHLERIERLDGARIVQRLKDGSMVRLRLDEPLRSNRTRAIKFHLVLHVPRDNSSLGRSAGADLITNALPVVAVSDSRGIRTGPEPAYGEGSLNPVALWGVSVRVPQGLRVVMPGRTRTWWPHTRTTTYESTEDVRDFSIAIGRFNSESQSVDGVRVTVLGTSKVASQLPIALERAVKAFTQMQLWYGDYYLESLRIVIGNLPFGGAESHGLILSTPDNATIAHEVAHQWFYGMIGSDEYRDPFLDESLTAFAEQRLHRSYRCNLASPLNGHKHGLRTSMAYWQKHPTKYEDTIYRGGACALTVLQRDLGEDVFDRAIRAYVAANRNEIAGVDDFLAAIRSAAPGYDLARWEKLVGLR